MCYFAEHNDDDDDDDDGVCTLILFEVGMG
jgi:hypothetical protein